MPYTILCNSTSRVTACIALKTPVLPCQIKVGLDGGKSPSHSGPHHPRRDWPYFRDRSLITTRVATKREGVGGRGVSRFTVTKREGADNFSRC